MMIEGMRWSELSQRWKKIWEWKTKILYECRNNPAFVIMVNKDDITAWDWARAENFEWKAKLSTAITANVFEYLKSKRLPVAYQHKLSDNEILAEDLDMIPLEVVYRFIATWSYIKREKALNWEKAMKDWTVLDQPVYELFYKNDVWVAWDTYILDDITEIVDGKRQFKTDEKWKIEVNYDWRKVLLKNLRFVDIDSWDPIDNDILLNWKFSNIAIEYRISDPMIQLDEQGDPIIDIDWKLILLYPDTWESIEYFAVANPLWIDWWRDISKQEYKKQIDWIMKHSKEIKKITAKVFQELQNFYQLWWVTVFDGKIEFWTSKSIQIDWEWDLMVWDVIDADSCRLRKDVVIEEKDWVKIVTQQTPLDKEWFRAWESTEVTRNKYEILAKITWDCLKKAKQLVEEKSTSWQIVRTLADSNRLIATATSERKQ